MASTARAQQTGPVRQPAAAPAPPLLTADNGWQNPDASWAVGNQVMLRQTEAQSPDFMQPQAPITPGVADPVAYAADRLAEAYDRADPAGALRALRGHDETFSQHLEVAFFRRTGKMLRPTLRAWLTDDAKVEAFGLLRYPRTISDACRMARALIASGVRDDDVLTILYQNDLAGRQRLRREYNLTFKELGQGLEGDLDNATGWVAQKARILLKRDLTPADELYFLTSGIVGTKTPEAVTLLQDEWAKGPANFDKLVRDWDDLIVKAGLARFGLEEEMRSEIGHEMSRDWDVARQIFLGYQKWLNAGLARSPGTTYDADMRAQERSIQAEVAWNTLKAASAGPGTAEQHVTRAATDLYRVRMAAIDDKEAMAQSTDQAWGEWEQERKQFLDAVGEEMSPGSQDYENIRLKLMTDPREKTRATTPLYVQRPAAKEISSLTDQLYVAWKLDGDYAKTVAVITKAWATGQIDNLREDAAKGKTVDGEVVRPPFPLHLAVTTEHMALVERGWSDARRGGRQLTIELLGNGENALKRGYTFITNSDISPALQKGVIREFAEWALKEIPGKTPEEKLWTYIDTHYPKNAPSRFDWEDLLFGYTKSQNVGAQLDLLQRKRTAVGPGALVGAIMTGWDTMTGEDRQQLEAEELSRLEYLVDLSKRDPQALTWLQDEMGAKSIEEVVARGFSNYKSVLGAMVSLKNSVVEIGASTAELLAGLVVGILTAGAGIPLLAGLASSAAGTLVRKAGMGDGFDMDSDENIQKILSSVALEVTGSLVSAGMGSMFETTVWGQLKKEATVFRAAQTELSKGAQFWQGAASQLSQTAMKTALDSKKVPSSEDLAEKLALFATGQALGKLGSDAKEAFKKKGSLLREETLPELMKGTITGSGNMVATWALHGFDKRPDEAAGEVGSMISGLLKSTFSSTVKKHFDNRRSAGATQTRSDVAEANHGAQVYRSAKEGGTQRAFYRQYAGKSTAELRSALAQYEERGAKLERNYATLETRKQNWQTYSPQQQANYRAYGQSDIQQNWERIQILQELIREREDPGLFQGAAKT